MNKASVFKSTEGREKIRAYYNNILGFFPFRQRFVDTSFGKTFVLEAGNPVGQTVVFLHGSCSNSAAWLGDMAVMAGSYHVCAVDMPGEPGNSEDNRLDFESGEYPRWLKEALDSLEIEKAVLIGNSMGGWLALHFGASFPTRTSALVLLAPSGIVQPRQSFMDKIADISSKPDVARSVNDDVMGGVTIPKEVIEFMALVMENFVPYTGTLPVLTDGQMLTLKMPVLYIAGTADVTMDVEKASQRLLGLVPHATVSLNDGAHVIVSSADKAIPFLERELSK